MCGAFVQYAAEELGVSESAWSFIPAKFDIEASLSEVISVPVGLADIAPFSTMDSGGFLMVGVAGGDSDSWYINPFFFHSGALVDHESVG